MPPHRTGPVSKKVTYTKYSFSAYTLVHHVHHRIYPNIFAYTNNCAHRGTTNAQRYAQVLARTNVCVLICAMFAIWSIPRVRAMFWLKIARRSKELYIHYIETNMLNCRVRAFIIVWRAFVCAFVFSIYTYLHKTVSNSMCAHLKVAMHSYDLHLANIRGASCSLMCFFCKCTNLSKFICRMSQENCKYKISKIYCANK